MKSGFPVSSFRQSQYRMLRASKLPLANLATTTKADAATNAAPASSPPNNPSMLSAPADKPERLNSQSERRVRGRRRVALYGGSFDPITNAHTNVAAEILHSKKADEVWVIPCGPRPDKPSLRTSALNRFIMCHLAINGTFGPRFPVKVCDIEVMLDEALATLPLINMLEKKHPDLDFCFVLGEDLINDLRKWTGPNDPKMGERLYREKQFLVINRPGYHHDKDLPSNFQRVIPKIKGATLVETRLSSSEVRKRICGGRQLVIAKALTPKTLSRSASEIADDNMPSKRFPTRSGSTPQELANTMILHTISTNREFDWYDEIEGLVPLMVLSFIKRYNLYSYAP